MLDGPLYHFVSLGLEANTLNAAGLRECCIPRSRVPDHSRAARTGSRLVDADGEAFDAFEFPLALRPKRWRRWKWLEERGMLQRDDQHAISALQRSARHGLPVVVEEDRSGRVLTLVVPAQCSPRISGEWASPVVDDDIVAGCSVVDETRCGGEVGSPVLPFEGLGCRDSQADAHEQYGDDADRPRRSREDPADRERGKREGG